MRADQPVRRVPPTSARVSRTARPLRRRYIRARRLVFAWGRIPRTDEGEVANMFDSPPDIAIDIASPEQLTNWLVRRCLSYVDKDVSIALLVNPADRSVARFERDQTAHVLRDEDAIEFGTVLPGFSLTVADLFSALRLE